MQAGDRVYWLRHDRDQGSRVRFKVPAVFIGPVNKEDRDSATIFALLDGKVQKKNVKLTNLLDRKDEKEIDAAVVGKAFYNGKPLTPPQQQALEWLGRNSGLIVPDIEVDRQPKDWPALRTFDGLEDRGLLHVLRSDNYYAAAINDLGRSLLAELTGG